MPTTRGRAAWFVPTLVAACIFPTYLHGHMGCSDSRWSIFAATSLLDSGDLTLDEYEPVLRQRGFDFTERVASHYYNVYPIGVSLLAAPAVLILRPTAALAFHWGPGLRASMEAAQRQRGCPPAEGEALLALNSWTEQIIASAFVTATALLIYVLARGDLPMAPSVALMLSFAFGTAAWSTASRALWQHAPSMLLLTTALVLFTRGPRLFPAGMSLAMAYVVRPTNLVPLALLSLWAVLAHRRRAVAGYVAGVAVVLAPFFALNRHIYGAWLSTYYRPSSFGGNPDFTGALAGLVVSPSHGLLVYSPLLAFALAGILFKVRRRIFGGLDATLLACIVALWLVTALVNPIWWGGDSYGPRLLSDVLPFFFYGLIPAVQWLKELRGIRRAAASAAFAAAAMMSVAVHAQGALNPKAMAWNYEPSPPDQDPEKLWDWRHAPFLAGMVAPRGAAPCTRAAPPPPIGLHVVANENREVRLSWTAPGVPVGLYTVESGTSPGASDQPLRDTTTSTLTVRHIPPGTYYARVRARNACGVGEPSNELAVTVR